MTARKTGHVKFFNSQKGYGFIIPDEPIDGEVEVTVPQASATNHNSSNGSGNNNGLINGNNHANSHGQSHGHSHSHIHGYQHVSAIPLPIQGYTAPITRHNSGSSTQLSHDSQPYKKFPEQ
ncbi:hypothetical protein GGI07_005146 [Coemansia sp. Benny D115]|nr:hypothetical protein GGI07_005146 [Coemansia sp. Benny D115]